ncbi:hypothetical protein HanIR_Chr12g0615181 [Helianthus annuus]|nr:hypothetical protein HanIR_Chr12g0615181 [Helianthus annuus]
MAADPTSTPLHSLVHLINIKLISTNYLTWEKQVIPVLSYLKLLGHVTGDTPSPSETILTDNKTVVNPDFLKWQLADQKVLLLLNSTLTQEAMAETIGHTTAKAVWKALADSYSHSSIERIHILKDSLRTLQKGSSSVSEFGRKFKALANQLSAIGHPISDEDKRHWFLCGLGASFENFSTSQRTIHPAPSFRDLLANAENQEMFVQQLHGPQSPQAAFYVQPAKTSHTRTPSSSRGRGRDSSSRGRNPSYTKDLHIANFVAKPVTMRVLALNSPLLPKDLHIANFVQNQFSSNVKVFSK